MIKREQFSAWDYELHPECYNSEYLDFESVPSGYYAGSQEMSKVIVTYGYRESFQDGSYRWVKKSEAGILQA